MKKCADCRNIECRCADCYALVEVDGKWFCDIAIEFCENIECCNEYEYALVEDDVCEDRQKELFEEV